MRPHIYVVPAAQYHAEPRTDLRAQSLRRAPCGGGVVIDMCVPAVNAVHLRSLLPQNVARPPEQSKVAPVLNEASWDASQQTRLATSSTSPKRPIGIFDRI